MKYAGKFFRLALGMAVSLSLFSNAQADETAIVPLRPAELLKLLPPAETGWRMAVSSAQDVPDAWPRSKAVRQFILEGPGLVGQSSPATFAKCQMTIIDTGGHPGTKSLFVQSGAVSPGALSAGSALSGLPALRKDSGGKQKMEVLALDRFVLIAELEITTENPPISKELSKPERWLEKIDISALREASKNPAFLDVSKEHAMTVERIDEINPRKSSRSTWSFAVEIPSGN